MRWRRPYAAIACAAMCFAFSDANAWTGDWQTPFAGDSEASLDAAIRTLDRLSAISVSIYAQDVTVEQVMGMLSDATGVPIVANPLERAESVLGATVTIRAEDVSALSVLNQLTVASFPRVADAGAYAWLAVNDRMVLMDVSTMVRSDAARLDAVYPWSSLGSDISAAARRAGAVPNPGDAMEALQEADVNRARLDRACWDLLDLTMLGERPPKLERLYPSADFLSGGLRVNAPAHVHRRLREFLETVDPVTIGIRCDVLEVPRGHFLDTLVGSRLSAVAIDVMRELGDEHWNTSGEVAEGGVYRAGASLDDQTRINLVMSPEAPDGDGRRAVPLFVTAQGPRSSLIYEVQGVMLGGNLVFALELPRQHGATMDVDPAGAVRLLTICLTVKSR